MEFISQMLIDWGIFVFSLFVIAVFTSLVLMVYNFRAGFKNQKQEKHETAIKHYDSVFCYSKFAPSGLSYYCKYS